MLKMLGKKMTNNFGLKILAAFIAVILWIVVVNIAEPLKTQTFVTSVTPVNAEYIAKMGKYYEWLDEKNTISFSVTAERTVIEKLSNSDFLASADMEKIEYDEGSGSYRVPVSISAQKFSDKVSISGKRLYMDVLVEDLGTAQKAITTETIGSVADGCALGKLSILGSNVLKISGPYSIVSQVVSAVAAINVDGMSTDVTDTVVPVLYDADGEVIDTTKLKLSLSTVTVTAQILNTKDVAVEFATKGEPANGYLVTGIEHSLDTIRIKGVADTLNKITKITIPADVLDVTDVTEDLTTTVDITSYLPTGTSLVLNSDGKIDVTVKVEPLVTRTFAVPTTNLTIENLRDGYTADFGVDEFTVEIAGPESVMKDLRASNIFGTVDVGSLGRGDHQLEISFTLPAEDCFASAPVEIPVNIDIAIPEPGENTSGNGTTGTGNGGNTSGDENTPESEGTPETEGFSEGIQTGNTPDAD